MSRRCFAFPLVGLLALLGAPTLVSAQAHLPIARFVQQSAPQGRIPPGLLRLFLAPPRAHPQAPRPITRLLVKLKPGADFRAFAQQFSSAARHNASLAPLVAAAGSKPLLAYVRSHDAIHWSTYEVPSPDLLQPTINALLKDPDVLHAEPDYQVVPLSLSPPNNHYWGLLDWEHTYAVWGLGDTDEASAYDDDSTTWDYSWSPEQVSAQQAWSVYPGHYQTASERKSLLSSSPASLPVVADIDTGVDLTHPNFSFTGNPSGGITDTDVSNGGELNVSFSRSFVGPTFDGYQGDDPKLAMDDFGHGTATTGLIASAPGTAGHDAAIASAHPASWTYVGEQPYASAVPGLGFPAQVVALKVADANGDGSDSDLIDAMLYATADWTDPNTGITHPSPHAIILSLSLSLNTTNYSQSLQDAVDFCWNHGTLCVAAAGNDGQNAGGSGSNTPRYPARCDKVLAISATTYNYPDGGVPEQIASYSNYGDQIGVCAPGGDAQYYINSAPNAIVDPIPEVIMPFTLQPSYTVIMNDPNGTSADSQYAVDGFAGPYLGEFPGTSFSTPQVTALAALYASKHQITQSTPNGPQMIVDAIELGADSLNGYSNGGYDTTYGWGRINAAATIQDLNNRGATVGGCIGRVRYVDTVVGNVTVTATPAAGGPATYATTDPDGLYHIYNVPADPSGTAYNISATVFGVTATTQVTLYPGCDQLGINLTANGTVAISKVTAKPSPIAGSKNATGTVTLSAPAPTGGESISVWSSNPSVANPATGTVTVSAGYASAKFTIHTYPVASSVTVTIYASDGTKTVQTTLAVRPIGVKSVSLSPNPVAGGSNSTGTVVLEAPAAPGSITVTLSSNNTAVAYPTVNSITIVAGATKGTFTVKTNTVTADTYVTISATANGIKKSKVLTVYP
ncbi:MAG TPA: hypothetical protein VFA07_18185 [Chthonomonadaceae bacterium]|nr:hypothetical protein [Chthonomonadaceae bacterium]